MLIPNTSGFLKLDPRITPSIMWGSLHPPTEFANETLAKMAPKSLYISCIQQAEGTTLSDPIISLWIKSNQSSDCGAIGSCSDWQEISVGGISRGTNPPIGTEQEWCCKPVGAWYIQINTPSGDCIANQPYIWLKVLENCSSDDWVLVSPSINPILFGNVDPNEDDNNCTYPVGSVYYQYCPPRQTDPCVPTISTTETKSHNMLRWEKVQKACAGSDWINTNATPVVKLDVGVDFDCTAEAIECLPIGSFVYNEDCKLWVRLNCENGDNCSDWCFIDNHPAMTVTQGNTYAFDKELQTLTLPSSAARGIRVTCADTAPTADLIDGDIWINTAGSCGDAATEPCASTFFWASCIGTSGAWKKIWGPPIGRVIRLGSAALSPYLPENLASFPVARLTPSPSTRLPGAMGETLTFTLDCPAVVNFDSVINYSVLPVIELDGSGDPEPPSLNGNVAITGCLMLNNTAVSCNGASASDFEMAINTSTPYSQRLSCGTYTVHLEYIASHSGKTTGTNPDGSPIVVDIRQQDVWIESAIIDISWEEFS